MEERLGHLLPHRIEQLFQGVTGVLGGALGPEIAEHLVAAEAALARGREQGEEGKPSALGHDHLTRGVGEDQTSEGPKPEHERPLRRR